MPRAKGQCKLTSFLPDKLIYVLDRFSEKFHGYSNAKTLEAEVFAFLGIWKLDASPRCRGANHGPSVLSLLFRILFSKRAVSATLLTIAFRFSRVSSLRDDVNGTSGVTPARGNRCRVAARFRDTLAASVASAAAAEECTPRGKKNKNSTVSLARRIRVSRARGMRQYTKFFLFRVLPTSPRILAAKIGEPTLGTSTAGKLEEFVGDYGTFDNFFNDF